MKQIEEIIIIAIGALVLLFYVEFAFGTIYYTTNDTVIEISPDVAKIVSNNFTVVINNTERFHVDINRTTVKNILNIKMTTAYPEVSQAGDVIIINNVLCFYDGTSWKKAAGTGGC